MKKRLISFILAVILCTTLCIPVLAVETATQDEAFFGYTFDEEYSRNGDYILSSYYCGQPQRQYTIKQNDKNIYVTDLMARSLSSSYTIPSAKNYTSYAPILAADRWASAGDIYYKDASVVGAVQAIMMAYGNNRTAEVLVSVDVDTPFDELVAFLVSFIVGEKFEKWAEAAGYELAGWMGALAGTLVGEAAADITDGLIKDAFTNTVEAQETVWDFKATPKMDSGFGNSVVLEEMGSSFIVHYSDTKEWDNWHEGFTLYDWAYDRFARIIWDELFPYINFPGVSRLAPVFGED